MGRDYRYNTNALIACTAIQSKKTSPKEMEEILKTLTNEDYCCLHENHITLHSLQCHGNACIQNIMLIGNSKIEIDSYSIYIFLRDYPIAQIILAAETCHRIKDAIDLWFERKGLDEFTTNLLEDIKKVGLSNKSIQHINQELYLRKKQKEYEQSRIPSERSTQSSCDLAIWAQKTFGGIPLT